MSLPELDNIRAHAFFFDFDGTLVGIAPRPELVVVEERTRAALSALHAATDGAVAIITGRAIATVDAFLAPLVLPAAGLHGLERRLADGRILEADSVLDLSALLGERLGALIAAHPALHLESKGPAAATLHYRAEPALEGVCREAMSKATADLEGVHVLAGKMVVEARLDASDKGRAVRAIMAEAPFAGRRPVVAGDDVTDEDAFVAINALGGLSIKVGDGETAASHRAENTEAFLRWLDDIARRA